MQKLEGKILKVFESTEGNGFKKSMFYLDDCAEKFRNTYVFELWKYDCEMIDNYKVGDFIIVYFDIKGISWTDSKGDVLAKNTLKCWNIEHNGKTHKPI